jgi:hypothetical protein
MTDETTPEIYQLHVWIRHISPMIWRRLRMRADSTVADLHDAIQIAFGWSDFHLHRFRIQGRDYGVNRVGGPGFSSDARTVRLAGFRSRTNEWFLYEYDFGDGWQHVVRVERRLAVEPRRVYPVCVGGQRAAPPEDCGGPWAFLERSDAVPGEVREHLERILEGVEAGDREALRDGLEVVESLREWLTLDRFDRRGREAGYGGTSTTTLRARYANPTGVRRSRRPDPVGDAGAGPLTGQGEVNRGPVATPGRP